MKKEEILHMLTGFEGISEPRIDRHRRYPLNEILFLCINSVCCGYTTWEEIAAFGEEKLDWLRQYLPYENGICSHDTLNRVLGMVDTREFELFFSGWMESLLENVAVNFINIDGKSIRGSVDKQLQNRSVKSGGKSAIHLVHAWCSELNLCLGQYKTEEKSNEITAIPALLDRLEISGSLVSIDAMGCQTKIAEKIVEKGGDYLLGLKDNQTSLSVRVKKAFEKNENIQVVDNQYDRDHGRAEIRQCHILSADLLGRELCKKWVGIQTIIRITAQRKVLNKPGEYTVDTRYYISSRTQTANFFNQAVRGHWAIENQLHWSMDVIFGEDKATKQRGNVAQNFAILLKIVFNLLKNNAEKKNMSVKRKMMKCILSDEYRKKTLRF